MSSLTSLDHISSFASSCISLPNCDVTKMTDPSFPACHSLCVHYEMSRLPPTAVVHWSEFTAWTRSLVFVFFLSSLTFFTDEYVWPGPFLNNSSCTGATENTKIRSITGSVSFRPHLLSLAENTGKKRKYITCWRIRLPTSWWHTESHCCHYGSNFPIGWHTLLVREWVLYVNMWQKDG